MNRRLFFGTLLGAFAGGRLAPTVPPYGSTGGAIPGAIVGSLTREQVAEWFDVPPELIGESSTLQRMRVHLDGRALADAVAKYIPRVEEGMKAKLLRPEAAKG